MYCCRRKQLSLLMVMFFSNLLYRNGKTACCSGYKMNKTSGNCDSTYRFVLHKACFGVNVILYVFINKINDNDRNGSENLNSLS